MKKFKLLLSTTPAFALPLVAVSCGQNIDSTEKIKQDEEIKKTAVNKLKAQFTNATILSLYNIDFQNSESLDSTYITTFKNEESQLFKDTYKAFQLYAQNKISSDAYYFAQKVVDWTSDRTLNAADIQALGVIEPNTTLTKEQFKVLWLNEKTELRAELEKMLFVNKYFQISDKDNLKKIDKNFKYTKDLKYELKNYLLAKYAVDKKYAQIWSKDAENASDDAFFTQGYNNLKDVTTFNDFWKFSNQVKTKLTAEIEFISGHDTDKQLLGYKGFKSSTSSYALKWDYDSLKNKTHNKELYGYYDVNNERLVNSEIEHGFVINPYKIASSQSNTPTIVYVNQIAPIAATSQTELPNVENDDKQKTSVTLLSFDNTMYKDKLDVLSFLFYLNDSSLYESAIKSFAEIGYKIKINNVSPALREAAKDLTFVELV
ncbi:HinT-interacting membrane complex lipoprotein P60 [Mycoplasma simbae]|uniref:HinT-interacting membrane complex lipoprotein P60 n=1 Tax=Mycoplasma simbae TaxID=36744 RepID=UPI000496020B|nr:variable surface lipoprotein [Mycoplasma simbae]